MGKAIVALLALVGISGIPIAWIVLPIIAGILVYEYNNFPEKLANKLPDSISSSIDANFDTLNMSLSENIIQSVTAEFVNEFTKLRK